MLLRLLLLMWLSAGVIPPFSFAGIVQFDDSVVIGVSLYRPTDPIVQLCSSNFSSTVLRSDRAFLVEFYNSFCGHCRKFAPIYVKFSERVKTWQKVVTVSAINCALEENSGVCESNGIRSYPSFKFFPPNTSNYEMAKSVSAESLFNVDNLRFLLIREVLEVANHTSHPTWPDFSYVRPSMTLADIWSSILSTVSHVALIFEDAEVRETRSSQLILDLMPYDRVLARRLKSDHALATIYGVSSFPTVVLFSRTSADEVYRSNLHHSQLQAILSFVYETQLTTSTATTTTELPRWSTTESIQLLRNKFYVSETDLLLAIRFSLFHEVGLQHLNGSLLRVLEKFVNLTAMYAPSSSQVQQTLSAYNYPIPPSLERMKRVRSLLKELVNWLSEKMAGIYNEADVYVTSSEWKNKWKELEMQHSYPFPANSSYDHCRGSQENLRGYSCGLWHTFHTLTVNAYLTLGVGPNAGNFDSVKILQIIKEYIGSFFGCTDCVRHFLRMANERIKIEENVKFPSDVILWLWNAHNLANQRLAGDPTTEDPQFPKRQFPAIFLCDDCQDFNGEWDYRQVMKYLAHYYTYIRPHREILSLI